LRVAVLLLSALNGIEEVHGELLIVDTGIPFVAFVLLLKMLLLLL
jgi:hypothetical protein